MLLLRGLHVLHDAAITITAAAAAVAESCISVCMLPCMQDNGCGMSHADIPNMLGRVLSGTKYGVKQVRGRQCM
jgi:DNA topoisomerase VI subunit B